METSTQHRMLVLPENGICFALTPNSLNKSNSLQIHKPLEATSYQIARALVTGEVDLDEANKVMEQVGEQYPLSLEEMATMIGKVHTAHNLGEVEEPSEEPTDARAWQELLARLNPKYTIFTDDEGNVNLGLK